MGRPILSIFTEAAQKGNAMDPSQCHERNPQTGTAYRLEIGSIYLRKWIEACPKHKTIILQ